MFGRTNVLSNFAYQKPRNRQLLSNIISIDAFLDRRISPIHERLPLLESTRCSNPQKGAFCNKKSDRLISGPIRLFEKDKYMMQFRCTFDLTSTPCHLRCSKICIENINLSNSVVSFFAGSRLQPHETRYPYFRCTRKVELLSSVCN